MGLHGHASQALLHGKCLRWRNRSQVHFCCERVRARVRRLGLLNYWMMMRRFRVATRTRHVRAG